MWLCNGVTIWLCDYVIAWLCDSDLTVRLSDYLIYVYVITWLCDSANMCTCDYWLCDYITVWLCDCVAMWLCDYVTWWLSDCDYVTTWLFRLVAQRASSYTHRTDTSRPMYTSDSYSDEEHNVSGTLGLTHYWHVQALGNVPTQLPFSLTPSSLSCRKVLQYICWRHVSAVEKFLRWPPASFKQPHPRPISTFCTYIPLSHALK